MKTVKPLTNTTLQSLKPQAKEYRKYDGNGLYIRVRPNKSKHWFFSYKFSGKEKKIFLGEYPASFPQIFTKSRRGKESYFFGNGNDVAR